MSTLTECPKGAIIGARSRPFQPRFFLAWLGCAAMMAASGCTTMHTVDSQSRQIEAGQTVVVSQRDGREVTLSFVDWTSAGLSGTDDAGILQKIENEDIARVEVERISALRSLGVVAVVLAVVVAAAVDASDFGYNGSL